MAGAEAAILDPDWDGYVEDGSAALLVGDDFYGLLSKEYDSVFLRPLWFFFFFCYSSPHCPLTDIFLLLINSLSGRKSSL